jgi:uncharacterized protein YndB with AHSA1/START domain
MYGTVQQLPDERWQLRFTRVLRHPPELVWRAITDPEHLADWFPTTVEGDRRAGARLRFAFRGGEAPPMDGEMLAYEPRTLLEFRWGTDVIRIELREVPGGTELTLLDTLEVLGKAARDAAGWHVCLDALESSLGGAADAREEMTRWAEVQPHYVESFGPEAATIGPPEGMG